MISAQTLTPNSLTSPVVNMTQKTCWAIALLFPLVAGPVWCLAWHGHGGRVGTLAGLVLLATLLTSAVSDMRRQRIYNWVTYSAFLWALLINVVASILAYHTDSQLPSLAAGQFVGPPMLGGVGFGAFLAGAGVCFLILLFGYDLSGGGAGDVKIATVIGGILGFHDGLFAVGYSYVIAGVAIIAWSMWTQGPLTLAKAIVKSFGRLLGPLWPFATTSADNKLLLTPVPLGPYFAIGTILVMLGLVPT